MWLWTVFLDEISFVYLEAAHSSEMRWKSSPPIPSQKAFWQVSAWNWAWKWERVLLGYWRWWEGQPRVWGQAQRCLVILELNLFVGGLPRCLLDPRHGLPYSRDYPRVWMPYADGGWDLGRMVSAIRGNCWSR